MVTTEADVNEEINVGNGVLLDASTWICYLGDVLNAAIECDLAVMARVRCAWKSF